jgi:hypothetical protein
MAKVKRTSIENTTDWPRDEVMFLIQHVLKKYKRNHKFEPLDKIVFTYDTRVQAKTFSFWYQSGVVMIKMKRNIKFPVEYMGQRLPEWKDLFIMCFAWAAWHRVKHYSGRGSSEVANNWAVYFAKRWRIDTLDTDVLMDKLQGI